MNATYRPTRPAGAVRRHVRILAHPCSPVHSQLTTLSLLNKLIATHAVTECATPNGDSPLPLLTGNYTASLIEFQYVSSDFCSLWTPDVIKFHVSI